jgi:ribonucleotide monophosphatase NagD (HAD superfamily)
MGRYELLRCGRVVFEVKVNAVAPTMRIGDSCDGRVNRLDGRVLGCDGNDAPVRSGLGRVRVADLDVVDAAVDCVDDKIMTVRELVGEASRDDAAIEAFRQPDAWHAALGRTYYLIAPDDGELLLQDLGYTRVENPSEAAFVLNTGSTSGTDLAHYERALRSCATRSLPMICANPDLFVKVAGRRIMCAGTIARRYEALGGTVRYHGKPGRAIYQECLKRMKRPVHAVLAIGDGLETDIAGARGMDVDSVFVLGGLHAESLSETGAAPARDQLQTLFARSGHAPTYVIPYLRW